MRVNDNGKLLLLFNNVEQVLNSIRTQDVVTLDYNVILIIHHSDNRQSGQRRPLVELLEVCLGSK